MDSPTRQLHQQVFSAETASSIDEFINKLKRGHLQGSKKIALETANLMRQLVSNSRWDDATTLTQLLITVGRRLIKAQPRELLIMNIVCRVIHIVNEVAPTQPSTPTTPRGEFSASVSRGSMTPAMGLGVGAGVGGGNGNGNGSGSGSGARSGFVDQVAGALAKQQHESQGAFRLKQEIIGEIN
ncbi:GCD complex subunit gcd7, partial [Kickxella alabastrina]